MAKNSITDYSKTAASNTDIQSVDIAEGCLPSGINNAIREIMADLADMNDGTVSLTSPSFAAASLTGDLSFGDNDKAIFGAGSDLQIYHDGSNSYVKDAGTGNLNVQGNHLSLEDSTGTRFFLGLQGGETRIYNQGNEKLAATSTGIDVTGTVTADGLTIDGDVLIDDGVGRITLDSVSGSNRLLSTTTGFGAYEDFEFRADNYIFKTSTTERLRIANNGDISFYEDTGTTAKLFWDASAESLGIGTSSPADKLHVEGNIYLGASNRTIYTGGSANLIFQNNTGNMIFSRNNGSSESMRIDSSGNVLVGQTAANSNATGIGALPYGSLYSCRDGGAPFLVNRKTSDGDIALFQKNGSTVGSIGVDYGSRLYIGTGDTGLFFNDLSDAVQPISTTGGLRGNAIDLGTAGATFKDLYLSSGVYVGGTGSANHLDDYEEGTWTPSFSMVSGSATFTYQGRAGYYTKVGRLVTVHFAVHSSGVTVTTDGKVRISGLPFTSSNANALLRSYSVGFKQLIDTAEVGILYAINNLSNVIEMYEGHTTYPESNRLVNASILTNDRRVRGVLQYLV